jgi:glycosyltransferase involved in cell wall biosynthesis
MRISVILDNELNSDIRVLREIKLLKENGFDVSVLCLGFDKKKYEVPVPGITVERISLRRKLKDTLFFFLNTFPAYEWLWTSHISRHIRKTRPDYMHVHDLYMARSAHKGIRRSGKKIPIILDLHENYPFTVTTYNWTKGFLRNLLSRPEAWKKKEREYLCYADRTIVLSGEYRDRLIEQYPELKPENFCVFPNVPDLPQPAEKNEVRVDNPFNNGFPVLLYYGVIAERRGVFETIQVFTKLVREGFPVNLLFIGPVDRHDRPRFEKAIYEPILSDNLRHISWIDARDFPAYLKISDICLAPFHVNPQHESGVANKVYDYMLGGKPLIVSACRPQKNLVEKHECGLVFHDQDEYYRAIIRLAGNESLRRAMGANGYTAIRDHYNIPAMKDQLLSGCYSPRHNSK